MKNVKNVVVKGKSGAPAKQVDLPRGKFTIEEAYQYNRTVKMNKVCKLTVLNFIKNSAAGYKLVKTGDKVKKVQFPKTLTLLEEVVKKDGAGRPCFLYIKSISDAETSKSGKAVKVTPTVVAVTSEVASEVATPVVVTIVPDVTPACVTPVVVSEVLEPVAY
jgi:hypothetical protein